MGNSTSKSEGNSGSSGEKGARPPLRPVTEKAFESETKHQEEIGEKYIAVRNLVFWRNGLQFHILEGEGNSKKITKLSWLCPYEDPRSEVILKEIIQGFVPPNLAVVRPGQLVEVHVLIQPKKEYANGTVKIIEPSGKPGNDDEPLDLKAYLRRVGCDRLVEQIQKSPKQTIQTRSKEQGNMTIMHLKGGNLPIDIPTDNLSTQTRSQEVAVRYLVFYHNGFHFQIREGDGIMHCSKLMKYDDPHSAKVLKEITRGSAPTDILGLKPGQLVDLLVYTQLKDDFPTTYVASPGTTLLQSGEVSLNTKDPRVRVGSTRNSDSTRSSDPELPQRIGGIYPAKMGDAAPPRSSEGILNPDPADGQMVTSGQEAFDILAYLSHIGCSALWERLQGLLVLLEKQGHPDDGGPQSEADQTGTTDSTVFPAGNTTTDGSQRAKAKATSGESGVRAEKEEETAICHVTFWHNGFQFSGTGNDELDAKLNKYDDPDNKVVLEEILQGTIRPGLLGMEPGQAVELLVSKRTAEDFPTASKELASGTQERQDDTSELS